MSETTDLKIPKKQEYEFGGPIGNMIIMVFSMFIPYYFWYCLDYNNGKLSLSFFDMTEKFLKDALPTIYTFKIYLLFLIHQVSINAKIGFISHLCKGF
jgi:hypothetical protein